MVMDREFQGYMEQWMKQTSLYLERVMIFMDAGYWRKCLEEQFKRTDVDLNRVIAKLVANRRLVRTYYYTGKIDKPPNPHWEKQRSEQQKALAFLAKLPFVEVRLGRLQFDEKNKARQKGVDVLLSLDMLRFALKNNYDTAVLVTGDGDFADIVRMVKDEGRKVESVVFCGTQAFSLQEAADTTTEITEEWLKDCWIEKI